MNLRTSWITLMGAGAVLVAGQATARQDAPSPAPSPPAASQTDAPATRSSDSPARSQAVFQTSQGEVTLRSTLPPAPPTSAAPSFEQLSGASKFISIEQANAYPLLANDFDYADSNRDHRISAAEYARWSKQQ